MGLWQVLRRLTGNTDKQPSRPERRPTLQGREGIISADDESEEEGDESARERRRVAKLLKKGLAEAEAGNYDKAIDLYSKVIDHDGENPLAYYNRGWAYGKMEDYDRALGDYG